MANRQNGRRFPFGERRILSLILICSLLLTGCKSILVSGDLSFTAYAPVEPTGSSFAIHEALYNSVDLGKYQLDGNSAFWLPPYHLNPIYVDNTAVANGDSAAVISEFLPIDYDETTGRFVYAYLTPYFGGEPATEEQKMTGLTVPEDGNASGIDIPSPEGAKQGGGYVLVLMSYAPQTKDYYIFHSRYISQKDYEARQPKLIAGKGEGSDVYYIYDYTDNTIGIYDIGGRVISEKSYTSVIRNREQQLLMLDTNAAIRNAGYTAANLQRLAMIMKFPYIRSTVTDVQIDEELYVYVTLQIEASETSFEAADARAQELIDTDEDVDDSKDDSGDYEEVGGVTYIYGSFSTFAVDVGGEDNAIPFTSRIRPEVLQQALDAADQESIDIGLTDDQIRRAEEAIEAQREQEAVDQGNYDPDVDYGDGITPEDVFDWIMANDLDTVNARYQERRDLLAADDYRQMLAPYWEELSEPLSSGYTAFDTEEILENGAGVYYVLAGIPDLTRMSAQLPGGTVQAFTDPRADLLTYNYGYRHVFAASGITTRDLSYSNAIISEYISSCSLEGGAMDETIPHYRSDFPFGLIIRYDNLTASEKSFVDSLIRSGSLGAAFLKYGSGISYPWLTPGDFTKETYDPQIPGLRRMSQSPYSAYDASISQGSDGFYHYHRPGTSGYCAADVRLNTGMPLVMAYTSVTYADGNVSSAYLPLYYRGYYDMERSSGIYPLPKMTVKDTQEITVTQPIVMSYGARTYTFEPLSCTVALPVKYRMIFPENMEMTNVGNIWLGESIKTVEGLGCVTYRTGGGTGRLPYDALTETSQNPSASDQNPYSRIQQMHLGEKGAIFDEYLIGKSTDVGTYRLADGRDCLVYFTDQAMRFYVGDGTRYHCFRQIRYEDLKNATGYRLNVETQQQDTATQSDADARRAEAAVNEDGITRLMADNVYPYSTTRTLLFQDDSGIRMYDSVGDTVLPLLTGHYYRIYPTEDPGIYTVLGFQTDEYQYTPADVAMAKYYTLDLGALVRKEGSRNVNAYMDRLRDHYHSVTHTMRAVGDGGSAAYEIVPPDPSDRDYQRALRLFTGSDSDTLNELRAICEEFGVEVTQEMEEHALSLVRSVRGQRQALNDYYDLIGIQMPAGGLPDTWQYLKLEGSIFSASYEGMLEIMLVEAVLSDDYLNPSVTHGISYARMIGVTPEGSSTEQYEQYRRDYKEWQRLRRESDTLVHSVSENAVQSGESWDSSLAGTTGQDPSGSTNIAGMQNDELRDTIIDLYSQRNADEKDMESITKMEFYQAVIRDIREAYEMRYDVTPGVTLEELANTPGAAMVYDETAQESVSENRTEVTESVAPAWEAYLNELFKQISPDYGQDIFAQMTESGYVEFYEISGLPQKTSDDIPLPWGETAIGADLAKCRYNWQVEEVIVKYTLMTAAYHDHDLYQEAWRTYTEAFYDTPEAQQTAFKSLPCYGIIQNLRQRSSSLGLGKTWDEAVGDVLRKTGNVANATGQ